MRAVVLCLVALAATVPSTPADLTAAQPVYFWPMRNALDQYIAEQATQEGVLAVTVDPKRARAVMTDRIDSRFLEAMNEFFPIEEPDAAEEEEAIDASSDALGAGFAFQPPKNRPEGRPRGTIFLVDVQTRQVLWSTFLGDYKTTPDKLHREARAVVRLIQEELNPGS